MVKLGLIGYPLGHSYSAIYFNDKFKRDGIAGHYDLYPIPDIECMPSLIAQHPELCGLNVTIPYKEKVLRFLDNITDEAKEIGAVNVIKIRNDGDGKIFLTGHNSDWVGFLESLAPLLRPDISSALILGTGGASKAVAYALRKVGINITFVSRNPKNSAANPTIGYGELNDESVRSNLLIVNTTPLGMFPDTDVVPQIPYKSITDRHVCYDLVYNPEETKFMRLCSDSGATVKNGLDMLYLQADAAWKIWSANSGI